MTNGSSIPGRHAAVSVDAAVSKKHIVTFVQTASLEVTMPTAREIEQIASWLPRGTEVFLSDIPRRSAADLTAACTLISAAGLVPVPHLAVRRYDGAAAFERILGDCVELGGVRKVMLIAGDYDVPTGPFGEVADALRTGIVQRCGIGAVAVAGYPEGHPRIATVTLDAALATKLSLLADQGLGQQIVTQFGFDPAAIGDWLLRQRRAGAAAPVAIGIAGPATAGTLLKFAIRCGVRTATRGLLRSSRQAMTQANCSRSVGPLAEVAADRRSGPLRAHFFSFGGVLRTVGWIRALQDGRFTVVADGAIQVDSSGE